MRTILSIKQCEFQLQRARRAYSRALEGTDAAKIERTGDNVAKWDTNLRIARGQNENDAFNAVNRI